MKKDIKDYLHLYIGQEVYDSKNKAYPVLTPLVYHTYIDDLFSIPVSFKLLLRPLSDMTEQEKNTWLSIQYYKEGYDSDLQFAEALRTQYLLKQGFDLFGLIQDGLALNKTLIK